MKFVIGEVGRLAWDRLGFRFDLNASFIMASRLVLNLRRKDPDTIIKTEGLGDMGKGNHLPGQANSPGPSISDYRTRAEYLCHCAVLR